MNRRATIRIAITFIAIVACANMAEAQWYSSPNAQNRGSSSLSFGANGRMGGTTYYNNANGSSAGMATRMGNTTYYNNSRLQGQT